ncbi:surface-adhesin E family protein [Polynucleobacter paneuropaeus]|jgi:hypothetical protein|uniref:surface-adhesin E family protein n=1 Tax=Polynucleobacter paneuropaeus TaxID=2527775 RepID=UPI001BFE8982|nr:surface-adhesin E family protein [Polynucleobacter paneuropaeus]MBT8622534.1 hypothetical protein [Polynucleobacter paneuropaeus]
MKKLLFTLLVFPSVLAHADWSKTGFSDETTMFIDAKTIKKSGNLVRVTELMNLPLGAKSPDGKVSYKSSKTVEEFDCKKQTTRTIKFSWYSDEMGKGKQVYKDDHSYPFEKIEPKSLIASVQRAVCPK